MNLNKIKTNTIIAENNKVIAKQALLVYMNENYLSVVHFKFHPLILVVVVSLSSIPRESSLARFSELIGI